ncbi:MAG: hypothetical protein JXQ29_06785, partial [Planctomycetes bacterium]|nr:hypothetical protein [Planctomycetota bacterium]
MASESPRLSSQVRDALAWATRRWRRRRVRRFLVAGLAALLGAVLAGVVFSGLDTAELVLATAAAGALVLSGSLVLARVLPVAPEIPVWIADRAFQLGERLVTALDPGARSARFAPLLAQEVEMRLGARRSAPPRSSAAPAPRRLRRVLRRWRAHLLVLLLLALVLFTHGALGPRVVPADVIAAHRGEARPAAPEAGRQPELTLALDAGRDPEFPRGAPIGCELVLRGGSTLERLAVHIHGERGQRLAVEPLGIHLGASTPLRFDLAPVLRSSGTDGPGRRTVFVRGQDPSGGTLESGAVAFRIQPPRSGDGDGGQGGQDRPEPHPEPPAPPADRPPPVEGKSEKKGPELPPPLGDPRRTPLESIPQFVLPLLD